MRMKAFFVVGMMAVMSSSVLAQGPGRAPSQPADDARLATRIGHELDVSVGHYTYIEPGEQRISIHGPKIGGEYTGTVSISRRRQLFLQADARGTGGSATYDGWCAPFLITPDSTSPNGYALDLGDYSPCSESGDSDWYLEGRALVSKDFIGRQWGVSPQTGLGFRHLSNGTTGIAGFRTDDYLYLPLAVTARTRTGSRGGLSFRFEYDVLLRGWQTTRQSALGGGAVPATPTAPAFTIDGFTDFSFSQHSGWALRASGKYEVNNRWSVEPSYIYWRVGDSPVSSGTVTFTVNQVSAQQELRAFEPFNLTHEFLVNLGFHF